MNTQNERRSQETNCSTSQGDISSVFTSLSGTEYRWPKQYASLKQSLRPAANSLEDAWRRLESSLDLELREIRRLKSNIIPTVHFHEIQQNEGRFPKSATHEIKKRGVVVVRGTVPVSTARGWKDALLKYAADNPAYTGYPAHEPQVLELYWSKPQLEARQHSHVHQTMLALNRLWSTGNTSAPAAGNTSDSAVSFEHCYTYGERLRIRQVGDKSFTLGAHMDGGSIERFLDPAYRASYASILENPNDWEHYDPFGQGHLRALANPKMAVIEDGQEKENSNGGASIFRSFQGWIALSSIGPVPNAGTLKVLPLLRESTAYVMLRPFLSDVPEADFCGAYPGKGQDLLRRYHSLLIENLVCIPEMEPGDTVWWHPDLIHAVEAVQKGREDSSVFYIPALPATASNAEYIRRQRERFLAGRTPPDFPPNDSEVQFKDRGTINDLTKLGRQLLGVDSQSDGSRDTNSVMQMCDKILGH